MILEMIEKENDIKNIAAEDWNLLAEEIRDFLIKKNQCDRRTFGI